MSNEKLLDNVVPLIPEPASEDVSKLAKNINLPIAEGKSYDKLNKLTATNLESLKLETINYQVINENIGNFPMPLVGRIYDPNVSCDELFKGKPYLEGLKLRRGDKDIEFKLKTNNIQLPKFFSDLDYAKNILMKSPISQKEIDSFSLSNYPITVEYQYKYFHTIEKPRFIGPRTLTITEDWKIIYVSPLCIVAEVDIYCTGFLLVDTFHTIHRYTWKSDLLFNEAKKKFSFNTNLCIELEIKILKENYMTGTIKTQGLEDHTTTIKEKAYTLLSDVLTVQSSKYYKGLFNEDETHIVSQQRKKRDFVRFSPIGALFELFSNFAFLGLILLVLLLSFFGSNNLYIIFVSILNLLGLGLIYKRLELLEKNLADS